MSDIGQLRPSWVRKIEVVRVPEASAPGECWIWHGATDKASGYGRVGVDQKCLYMHRVVYERLVGPIPDGLHLDHLCRVRACCAPHHLEAVTHQENVRRGSKASQTHCQNGHPLSGDNLYVMRVKTGPRRVCRTCRDTRTALWRAKRRDRQAATWSKYLPNGQVAS